jgi:activating signal cointegrator 1
LGNTAPRNYSDSCSQGKSGSIFAAEKPFQRYIPDFNALPFGAIIGSVNITDVIPITHTGLPENTLAQLTMEEKAFGDYSVGRYAWLLSDAVMFEHPIPARGMLNVWDFIGSLPNGNL